MGGIAVSGSTCNMRPSILRTTTICPAARGDEATASQSSPWTNTFPCGCRACLHDAGFSDQALLSGDDFVAAGPQRDGHQERRDDAERNADCQRGEEMNAHFGDRGVHQEKAAEREERDASDGENSMGYKFGFGGKESESSEDQDQRGEAGREQIQRESGDENEYDADGSGNDRAGMIELDVERERPDRKQQECDVRVHEFVEDAFLDASYRTVMIGWSGEVEDCRLAVETLESFSLQSDGTDLRGSTRRSRSDVGSGLPAR